jgi:hypothetical protein
VTCGRLRDLENKVACNPNGLLSTHGLWGIEETGLGFDEGTRKVLQYFLRAGDRLGIVASTRWLWSRSGNTINQQTTIIFMHSPGSADVGISHFPHLSYPQALPLHAVQKRLKLQLNLSVINYIVSQFKYSRWYYNDIQMI